MASSRVKMKKNAETHNPREENIGDIIPFEEHGVVHAIVNYDFRVVSTNARVLPFCRGATDIFTRLIETIIISI